METYGVSVKNIPSVLGGAFQHVDYLVWLRQQEIKSPPQPPEVHKGARAA
jgi:hypothetical protein